MADSCQDCLKYLFKALLGLFNVIFFLLGLFLLAIGILIKTTLSQYVQPLLDSALKSLAAYDSSSSGATTAAPPTLDLATLLGPVAVGLIIVGIVLMVVTGFGCFGVCCDNKALLIIYVVVYGLFVIAQAVIVGMVFNKMLDGTIKTTVQQDYVNKYVDVNDYTLPSLVCNVVQLQFQCCGIDNYTDYATATQWRRNRYITVANVSVPITLTTPLTCCKSNGSSSSNGFFNLPSGAYDQTCATLPNDLISNWKTGCWGKVTEFLDQYRTRIMIGAIVAVVVEGLFVFMAIIVVCLLRNDKYKKYRD